MSIPIVVMGVCLGVPSASAEMDEAAKELFVGKCASCHSVGDGDRVGPDLAGVTKRRSPDWLERMIQTPSALLNSDADAKAMLRKYNNVRMPDLGLNDAQVASLVKLLAFCSDNPCELKGSFTPVTEATAADVERGRQLFLGELVRENGGPACVACHDAAGLHAVVGGGKLAMDLTHTFARLGDEGLDASLRNPAFPLMKDIFADAPMTEDEAFALRAFLYESNRGGVEASHTTAGQGAWSVPLIALLLAAVALVALNAAWGRRLRGVREGIVGRQEDAR